MDSNRMPPSPPPAPLTLVLFDIDGTLLNIHGAGKEAFRRALKEVFGWQDALDYISFAGNTDLIVLRRIMRERGHRAPPEEEARFFARLPLELEQTIAAAEHTLHPGVAELLAALHADARCQLGLVTGNIEPCARIKLRRFGLNDYFPFGGFGNDHADRAVMARAAVDRARRHLPPNQRIGEVFLVGDALSDVRAARAIRARSLAVATGSADAAALAEAGADHVFADLAQTAEVLARLGLS